MDEERGRGERRVGVWWNTWGGLIVTLAAALVSGMISGFTIYHNFDKRIALLEQRFGDFLSWHEQAPRDRP